MVLSIIVLGRAKNAALALHKGRFNKKMSLPPAALADVLWWESNVVGLFSPIHPPPIAATFFSDASLEGWGGTDEVAHVGGRWTEAEMPHHINTLELHAAYLTLQALCAPHTCTHSVHVGQHNCHYIYKQNGGGGGGGGYPLFDMQ